MRAIGEMLRTAMYLEFSPDGQGRDRRRFFVSHSNPPSLFRHQISKGFP